MKKLTILLELLHRSNTRIQACLIGNWCGSHNKRLRTLRAKQRVLLQKADLSDKHDCNTVLMIVSRQSQSKTHVDEQPSRGSTRYWKRCYVLRRRRRRSLRKSTTNVIYFSNSMRTLIWGRIKNSSQKKKKLRKRRTDVVNNIARLKITLCVMKHATCGTIVQAITERWGKKSPELKLYLDLCLANPVMRTPVEQSGQPHQHSTTRRMNSDDSETSVRNTSVQEFPPCTYKIFRNVYYRSPTQSGQLKKVELDLVVITNDDILVQVIEVKNPV